MISNNVQQLNMRLKKPQPYHLEFLYISFSSSPRLSLTIIQPIRRRGCLHSVWEGSNCIPGWGTWGISFSSRSSSPVWNEPFSPYLVFARLVCYGLVWVGFAHLSPPGLHMQSVLRKNRTYIRGGRALLAQFLSRSIVFFSLLFPLPLHVHFQFMF